MIISIKFYPEAKDRVDAEASDPEYQEACRYFEGAIEFIGKLERIEKAKVDKAMLDYKKSDNFPF